MNEMSTYHAKPKSSKLDITQINDNVELIK